MAGLPSKSGWYAARRIKGAGGHVVFATLNADGYMLGRVEGEPGGLRLLHDPWFSTLEFSGPYESPEVALERLLDGSA
jgi:hypothetical protein